MKRILLALLALGFVGNAQAQTSCAARLVAPFTPAEATKLCQEFGSAYGQSLIPSATNTYNLGSASREWATTNTRIIASSVGLSISAGGVADRATFASDGRVGINTPSGLNAQLEITTAFSNRTPLGIRGASGQTGPLVVLQDSTSTTQTRFSSVGELEFARSGSTISVQEATPASACMGTATPNGNTAVTVTTSCAVSGARVFYTRVGAVTNMGTISTTTNPNGTSFQFASTGATDTLASSVVWLIVKESA